MKDLKDLNKLLIVVDVINGFINEGSMKDESISRIIKPIVKEVKKYKKADEGIVFICDSHNKNAAEFLKFPSHCLKNTSEAELVPELKKYQELGLTYYKNSTSTIFAKGFLKDVKKMVNLKEVEIVGCCSDICILNVALPLAAYFDQINQAVKVKTPANLIDTFDGVNHNKEEYNMMALKMLELSGIDTKETNYESVK